MLSHDLFAIDNLIVITACILYTVVGYKLLYKTLAEVMGKVIFDPHSAVTP